MIRVPASAIPEALAQGREDAAALAERMADEIEAADAHALPLTSWEALRAFARRLRIGEHIAKRTSSPTSDVGRSYADRVVARVCSFGCDEATTLEACSRCGAPTTVAGDVMPVVIDGPGGQPIPAWDSGATIGGVRVADHPQARAAQKPPIVVRLPATGDAPMSAWRRSETERGVVCDRGGSVRGQRRIVAEVIQAAGARRAYVAVWTPAGEELPEVRVDDVATGMRMADRMLAEAGWTVEDPA